MPHDRGPENVSGAALINDPASGSNESPAEDVESMELALFGASVTSPLLKILSKTDRLGPSDMLLYSVYPLLYVLPYLDAFYSILLTFTIFSS